MSTPNKMGSDIERRFLQVYVINVAVQMLSLQRKLMCCSSDWWCPWGKMATDHAPPRTSQCKIANTYGRMLTFILRRPTLARVDADSSR